MLYNYKAADLDHLHEIFSWIPWNVIGFDADIESSWLQWKDMFFSAVQDTIPTVKWSKKKWKHWFSDSTIKLIHKKRQIYCMYKHSPNPNLFRKYKSLRNLVRKKCRDDTKVIQTLCPIFIIPIPNLSGVGLTLLKGTAPQFPLYSGVATQLLIIIRKLTFLMNIFV